MFRQVKNTSNLLDFVATRHCQGNPRPSLITEIRLTCTAALKVLLDLRLKIETLYFYFADKVQNLASSAEAFQLATKLGSSLSNTYILQRLQSLFCEDFSRLFIFFVNIIGGAHSSPVKNIGRNNYVVLNRPRSLTGVPCAKTDGRQKAIAHEDYHYGGSRSGFS